MPFLISEIFWQPEKVNATEYILNQFGTVISEQRGLKLINQTKILILIYKYYAYKYVNSNLVPNGETLVVIRSIWPKLRRDVQLVLLSVLWRFRSAASGRWMVGGNSKIYIGGLSFGENPNSLCSD